MVMSVSGLSHRPYASSFGSAASKRAGSPAMSASSYNSILLDNLTARDQCAIHPESHRLFYQARKLNNTKEALQEKVILCALCSSMR